MKQQQNDGTIPKVTPTSSTTYPNTLEAKCGELIQQLWAISGDRIPQGEELTIRAKSFAQFLGPHFFRFETDYVIVMTAKLRAWRGPIHADELLRIAEKVYGCPRSMWGYPDADCEPLVWSDSEESRDGRGNWILLTTAIERIQTTQPDIEESQILAIIYGE